MVVGISWKERITNVEVRTRTGQQTMTSKHTERKTTLLAWTRFSVWTTASTVLAGTRIQDRTRSTMSELRGVQPTKTYKRRGSPRRKQRWQLLTDTDGVGVWPNVSSWMRDEPRSRSGQADVNAVHVNRPTAIA